MRNLVYIICLDHDIAEILLKLALYTNQSIIPASSTSFIFSIVMCDLWHNLQFVEGGQYLLMFEFCFRCEASAKDKTNIESQVSTFVYINYMLQQKWEKLCLFTFPVQLVNYI